MKFTLLAIACLWLKASPALFASAEEKNLPSSLDSSSFKSASRMEKVLTTSNVSTRQYHRKLIGIIGDDYLRETQSFAPPSDTNQRFGNRIAASSSGTIIAITGSEEIVQASDSGNASSNSDSVHWRGYVQIRNLVTGTVDYVRSDIAEFDPPEMDVAMNGDGTIIIVAEVHTTDTDADSSAKSSVKVYKQQYGVDGSSTWSMVGEPILRGLAGELPGLRVDLAANSGETLVIGSRNFNDGKGRTMTFKLNSSGDAYSTSNVAIEGQTADDHEGSSVSITDDGRYYASGATGFDTVGSDQQPEPNRGVVRIFDSATNQQIGNPILGETEGDASGFSVSLTNPASNVLTVAIGAVYNDPSSDKINAGHVRVYTHTVGEGEPDWKQVGTDIDGENGDYLNFEDSMFHISDRFGFACKLSKNGKRLIAGAPYHHGNGNRDAGYYHGKVKLFELQTTEDANGSNREEWVQIAKDIVGTSKDSNSGHGLALDEAGKTIIVGGPSETGGSVKVYFQDEFSSQPSVAPSPQPSLTPSITPSARPSLQPSSGPSISPSLKPSLTPSSKPSEIPSMSPSLQPSSGPSLKPSQTPSFFSDRAFQILSTSPKFSNVGNNNDGRKWCLEGKLSAVPTNSIVKVRPCSPLRAHLQTWFLDNDKLSLSNQNPGTLCLKDEGRSLFLQSCTLLGTSSISFTSRDENTPGAIVVSRNGKSFYVAISTDKIFARLRLYTKQSVNPSKESWQLNYVSSTVAPSSQVISSAPSPVPSTLPSSIDWQQVHQRMVGDENGEWFGWATAMSSDSMRIVVGAGRHDSNRGKVTVFQDNGMSWVPVHTGILGNDANSWLGMSVEISANGKRIIVGSNNGYRSGQISVFQDDELSSWVKVNSSISGKAANDEYGFSVDMSADGSRIVVGALYSGVVEVYQDDQAGSAWVLVNAMIPGKAGDQFGCNVAISSDGTRIVAGACWSDSGGDNSGEVSVYQDDTLNLSWVLVHNKRIPGKAAGDHFGIWVDISSDGSRIAVGSEGLSTKGEVIVYDDVGSNWVPVHGSISGLASGDYFGFPVKLSADGYRLVVGAVGSGAGGYTGSGQVRVFDDNMSEWEQVANELNGVSRKHHFGFNIGMSDSGKRIAVGGPDGGGGAGDVRVFEK